MAFEGTTFSEVEAGLDEISRRLALITAHIRQAIAAFSTAVTELDAIATDYNGIQVVAANLLAADPTNAALINNDARVQKFLADRASLKTAAQTLESAVAGV